MAGDEEEDQLPPPEEGDNPDDETRRLLAAQPIGKSSPPPESQPAAQTIAPVGSTEDLENKAAARTIPRTAAPETGSTEDLEAKADTNNPLMKAAAPHPVTSGVASLWTKADNIHNPILRVLGKVGAAGVRAADTIGSIAAPGVAAMIPGSTINARGAENRQRAQNTEDIGNEQKEAQTGLESAQTGKVKAETNALENPEVKPKEEEWSIAPGFQGPNGEPLQQEKNSGQLRIAQVPGAVPKPEKQNDFEQFYHDYLTDNKFPDTAHNRLLAREKFAAAGQTPQKPQQQLIVDPSGKVIEVHPGMTLPQGSKTMAGDLAGNKPNAEELKRSEMAENMNENLDKLDEIVTRRPELFGKIGGRETQLRMMIGSNDADIAALKTIHDQMGMAQQSAHSMRSAQHVDAAANSILNSFVNGPDAIKSSIKTARDSLSTFTKDVQQGNPSVRTGASAPVYAANPQTKERVMSTDGGKTWQPAK